MGFCDASPCRRGRLQPGQWILLAVIAVLLTACAGPRTTGLGYIYADQREEQQPPVIVIPGLMGSTLSSQKTGEVVWGTGIWNLVMGVGMEGLGLPIEHLDFRKNQDELMPTGIIFGPFTEDYYESLVNTLEEAGGYSCRLPRELSAETDCVLFPWDWRRDLVEAAARLDRLIERIRSLQQDPALEVDLIGHSAGGLVARYYVRFASRDVLDRPTETVEVDYAGADKVRKAALIATPNFGSIFGLQRVMRGYRVGLTWMRVDLIATMPSVYQLLPHPDRAWMIDLHGRRLERDLYEPETWRRFQESIFDPSLRQRLIEGMDEDVARRGLQALDRFFARALRRGERFQRALSLQAGTPDVAYMALGGDCIPTPALCLLEPTEEGERIRLYPDDVAHPLPDVDYERLMLDPGDGRVTRSSMLSRNSLDEPEPFHLRQVTVTCHNHFEMPANAVVRHNLLNFLLY